MAMNREVASEGVQGAVKGARDVALVYAVVLRMGDLPVARRSFAAIGACHAPVHCD